MVNLRIEIKAYVQDVRLLWLKFFSKNYNSNYEFLRIQKRHKKLVNSTAHNQIIVSEEATQHNHSIGHSLLFMTIQINLYSLEL
jgi:hypothetical protein